ncbi:hypothetical protein N431DRAFT_380084 [Stipitochalara longipes BDJ]|nr:hypothetical protein N431DRAFT_380084 [Stipitochalara longipes BDJ]
MAPPHTMKYKDEPEIPISASSPTTLTPGMEALHLTTTSPFTPEFQNIANAPPTTPKSPGRGSCKVISLKLSPRENDLLPGKIKGCPITSSMRGKAILVYFSLARTKAQVTAAKKVDEAISRIKYTAETLAQSDGEDHFTENDRRLVVLMIEANKDFTNWMETYRKLVKTAEGFESFKGAEVWWEEIREIKGLVGEWEAAYPTGAWPAKIEKLGAVDEKIVSEYSEVRPLIWESWNERKKKGGDKSGGDYDDSGGSSGSESSADKSDGAKSDVGKKSRGKSLAEELEINDTSSFDGSVDESDESMEYISPSKIATKEMEEDVFTRMENFALEEEEEDVTENPDANLNSSPSPPKLVDLNFSPSRRAARSLGPKSPGSSSPKSTKARRPVSPVQSTSTPAQSLPVAAIPSSSFDFTFGPALPTTKPSRSSSPGQATPTPILLIATSTLTSTSKDFGADLIPLDTTKTPSQPPSPVQHTTTPAPLAPVVPLVKWSHFDSYHDRKAAVTGAATPQLSTASVSSNSTKRSEGIHTTTSPATNLPANPSPHSIFGLKLSTPISTPPVTPSMPSFNEINTAQKEARNFANKPPTASTLIELTRTTQSLQADINNLHSALYGFDTATQAPQSAQDAGLLLMNNSIGEWVTDIRIQTKTLDTKVNEIGSLVQGLGCEVTKLRDENFLITTEFAQKEKHNVEVMNEMKEMMVQQRNEMKEMREQQQTGFAALLAQNERLMQEVALLKQVKSIGEAEIRSLRIDNETFRKLVERLAKKIEAAIDHQLASAEPEAEANEEEEDALMQILWPQGDGCLDSEGIRKLEEKEVLQRGVLANEPGFRVPMHELGRGKPGGGWCTVM